MPEAKKLRTRKFKINHSFVVTVLLANGFLQLMTPVFAQQTSGGTSISNTATATYEDPNNPGTTINTTSNSVTVTVAEVAGITVTASGVTDTDPSDPVQVGELLYYNYTVTNVGNDPTRFRIPNLARVIGPATAGNLEYSTDGGTTWVSITGSEFTTGSIPVNGSILVRVPVTVGAGAQANDIISVTLGDTPGDGQNLPRDPNGGDVFTVDNPDDSAPGEVDGVPVNGVREASATQRATVNQSLQSYALATVLKTRSNYNNAGTPVITDDTLTYDLGLRVESNDPTGNNITPAPLVGAPINIDGAVVTRVLVSDAIPPNMELEAAPTPPPGWQVVYTTDPVTTTANRANWSTSLPVGGLSAVIRVGFVNNPGIITSIAPGTTVSGFRVQLGVRATATSPLTVNNIAQLFGQTSGVPPVDSNGDGVPENQVYDESGDNRPSNYNDDGTPGGGSDTNGDRIPDNTPPTVTDGYIDDPTDLGNTGTDTGNNNSSSGPGGEANSFTIQTPIAADVLNGPQQAPDAVGPTDNNDDFTNKSSFVPANTSPGTTVDPSPVAFTNTVRNSGTDPNNISLVPTPPTTLGDLPTGTVVTISYGSESRSYVWDGTNFLFDPDPNTPGGENPIDATTEYITIPNVPPGTNLNYGVEVNLPSGTPLSTDIERGFPVPITAFIDDLTPGLGTETVRNTTIDRVYTGYLKLIKESRILPGSGPPIQGNQGTFSTSDKQPAPGNIIEYRITYRNISTAQAGTGNIILSAANVVITEDGTGGGNNWALDNDSNGEIDTSNIVGSAQDSGASTINFYSGNPSLNATVDQTGTTVSTDVTRYINTVTGTVAPGETRTFSFQRQVN